MVIWLTRATIEDARALLPAIISHRGVTVRRHDLAPVGIRVDKAGIKEARMKIPPHMAKFFEQTAHVIPVATYVIDGLPSTLSEEQVVKTMCEWKSDSYPKGWEVIPQGKPYIYRGGSKWKVAAACDPPTFTQRTKDGAILIRKMD
eukprot:5078343-Karenia_brevis.AAC.1